MDAIRYINRDTGTLEAEHPPGEAWLRFLYHNPFGRIPLNLAVKRKFMSSLYGRLMDRPQSRKKIRPFVEQYAINTDEAVRPIEDFTSFNDFFTRKLKASARPVQDGLTSPADGKVIAFESIGDLGSFFVKGEPFTLSAFLKDKALAERFGNASMYIVRLAPDDYHRFHFPSGGTASETVTITGQYLSVSPHAIRDNFTRVFCGNKREYAMVSTSDMGDIIICPVGAAMVGGIIETYTPGAVEKGGEMGYFAFGGSSIVMLIDRTKVAIDTDLLENTKKGYETTVRMGERIGASVDAV